MTNSATVCYAMEGLCCDFKQFGDYDCGPSCYHSGTSSLIPGPDLQFSLTSVSECQKNTYPYLSNLKTISPELPSECSLIFARCGIFSSFNLSWTICPRHRERLGVKMSCSSVCQHPLHGQSLQKADRGFTMKMSEEVLSSWGKLISVGSGKTIIHLSMLSPRGGGATRGH